MWAQKEGKEAPGLFQTSPGTGLGLATRSLTSLSRALHSRLGFGKDPLLPFSSAQGDARQSDIAAACRCQGSRCAGVITSAPLRQPRRGRTPSGAARWKAVARAASGADWPGRGRTPTGAVASQKRNLGARRETESFFGGKRCRGSARRSGHCRCRSPARFPSYR